MDYYSYKKQYTHGDMFTLSGENYTGFIQYKDGKATTVDTNEELEPIATFNTDLFTSRIFRDRSIEDRDIQLPRTKSECLFGLNETFNYEVFKRKLDFLRENITYFYSRLFIASNNLPFTDEITYAGLSGQYADRFDVYKVNRELPIVYNTTLLKDSYIYSPLGSVSDTAIRLNYLDPSKFVLFNITSNQFVALTGTNDAFGVAEISSFYESLTSGPKNEIYELDLLMASREERGADALVSLPDRENDLQFKELGGITSNNTHMFITDKGNNSILKYDISGYLNDDVSIQNRRLLTKIMGGSGEIDRRSNFNMPTLITCNSEYVAIYDSGNLCVKIYTVDFEYVTTITLFNIKKQRQNKESVQAIKFDPDFKVLCILTTNKDKQVFLHRVNVNTRESDVTTLNEVLDPDEDIKCIAFSRSDSNLWYFCTTKNLYKKLKTSPAATVGYYNEERLFELTNRKIDSQDIVWEDQYTQWENTNFTWNTTTLTDVVTEQAPPEQQKFRGAHITLGDNGQDKIFIYNEARIYYFNEPSSTAYRRVINKFNYENFGVNGFSLSPKEYIQVPIINGELYKVISDVLTLKNNIVGRFAGKYENDTLLLNNYNYNLDFADITIDLVESYFVHHNEENITGALNRSIEGIYDLQKRLIDSIQVDSGDLIQSNTQRSLRRIDDGVCARPYIPPAKMEIVKAVTSTNPIYAQNDEVTYTVTITNTGGRVAENVTLRDSLLGNNFSSSLIIQDRKQLLTTDAGGRFNPGESVDVIYKYIVTDNDAISGQLTNIATVNTPKQGDVVSNAVTVSTIYEEPSINIDLSIKNKKDGGYYAFKDDITFDVMITNNGNIPISGEVLMDSFCGYPEDSFNNQITVDYNLLPGMTLSMPYSYTATVSGSVNAAQGTDYALGPRTCAISATGVIDNGNEYIFKSNSVNYTALGCNAGMDVCIVYDSTGSMADNIDNVKSNITEVLNYITNSSANNYRLSLMAVTEVGSSSVNNFNYPDFEQIKYQAQGTGTHFVFTILEKFNEINNRLSFEDQLQKVGIDVPFSGGQLGIPADTAILHTLSGACGEFRENVSKYIIFLSDTYIETGKYVTNTNVENLREIYNIAGDTSVKIMSLVDVDTTDIEYYYNFNEEDTSETLPNNNERFDDPLDYWKWMSEQTGGIFVEGANAESIINALESSCTLPEMNI